MKKLLSTLAFLLCLLHLHAQAILNEYIVTLNRPTSQLDLSRDGLSTKVLSKDLGIIKIVSTQSQDRYLEAELDQNPIVAEWSYNHQVHLRKMPNDEYFGQQWNLDMIEAPAAWEVTTGGRDIYDREIVVAVLDDSYDLSHPELEGRIFINEAEIEDDGIDNDNNGYIDDYIGWNTTNETDDHPQTDNHGTAVSGIIGAKSDNEDGISGINWNIKLLIISGIRTQGEVIAGYQYVIDMRRRYNETNGAEGAYIVVTNYSAGIDERFGTEPAFKSWCDMYDNLADVGVLSVGATTNRNTDVDELGDIPTTCPSDFLVSVTNTNSQDIKVPTAGYGLENIDLGAPGQGTLTLGNNNGYDQSFDGTSASCPHVAGTIALLYSAPCTAIADLAITDPREAAREIRDALYAGVSPNSTLEGITATGGRLNIIGAMEHLQESCSELTLPAPKGDLSITKLKYELPNRVTVEYLTPDNVPYTLLISDRMGRVIYDEDFIPPTVGRKVISAPLGSLIEGIYFISIYNEGNISTEKLFIQG